MSHGSKDRRDDPAGWLMRVLRDLGPEHMMGVYWGIYRGIVIDTEDPDKRGRVRVMVPAIGHQDADDVGDTLFALPSMPGLSKGKFLLHGLFVPPEVGDQVWVMFENGEPEKPVYIGGWLSNEPGSELEDNTPLYRGMRTAKGNLLKFSDDVDDVSVRLERGSNGSGSGTFIELKSDDSVLIRTKGGAEILISGSGGTLSATADDGTKIELGNKSFKVSTTDGAYVEGKGHELILGSKTKVTITAPVVNIDATSSLSLGKGAVEPAVKGASMSQKWQAHTHVVGSPWSVTAPLTTTPPLVLGSDLSSIVKVK